MPVQLTCKIGGSSRGRALLLIIVLFILFIAPASANSIQFSGLSQVNKSIDIYNINDIAAGGDGLVASINSSANFYFYPGDSYMFEIKTANNSTFLSSPLDFGEFIFSPRGGMLITFVFLSFLLFICLGGAFLLFGRKR